MTSPTPQKAIGCSSRQCVEPDQSMVHVRCGSKADMTATGENVRFVPVAASWPQTDYVSTVRPLSMGWGRRNPTILLAICMALAAALYTSVGHAGASAYIFLMALFSIAPQTMRPTALTLNAVVASFTSYRYLQAGIFKWRTLWPCLVGALPLAFAGGAFSLRVTPTKPWRASFC